MSRKEPNLEAEENEILFLEHSEKSGYIAKDQNGVSLLELTGYGLDLKINFSVIDTIDKLDDAIGTLAWIVKEAAVKQLIERK